MKIPKFRAYFIVFKVSLYAILNRPGKALSLIDKIRAETGSNAVLFFALEGMVLTRAKRYKEALIPVAMTYRNIPNSTFLSMFAWVLHENNKNQQALSMYEKLLRMRPKSGMSWNNEACVLNSLGHYYEALESVNKALTFKPRNVHILCTKGEIYIAMEQYEEGLLWIRQAIRRGYKPAWKYAALALHGLGREEEAQQAEEKVAHTS